MGLKIGVIGPHAVDVAAGIKDTEGLVTKSDSVVVIESDADVIVGTTCLRTYPNTVMFLKALLSQARKDKNALLPKKPKTTKKKGKKKKVEEVKPDVVEIKEAEIDPMLGTTVTTPLNGPPELESIEEIDQEGHHA